MLDFYYCCYSMRQLIGSCPLLVHATIHCMCLTSGLFHHILTHWHSLELLCLEFEKNSYSSRRGGWQDHNALLHALIGHTQPQQLIFEDLTIILMLRSSFGSKIFCMLLARFPPCTIRIGLKSWEHSEKNITTSGHCAQHLFACQNRQQINLRNFVCWGRKL